MSSPICSNVSVKSFNEAGKQTYTAVISNDDVVDSGDIFVDTAAKKEISWVEQRVKDTYDAAKVDCITAELSKREPIDISKLDLRPRIEFNVSGFKVSLELLLNFK